MLRLDRTYIDLSQKRQETSWCIDRVPFPHRPIIQDKLKTFEITVSKTKTLGSN